MLFTVRLKDNKEFVRLYGKGAFVSCGMCTVYYRRNGRKENRIGISTGKKIGNAVMRSRARRVIRQAYRENEADFPKGYDIVITARQGSTECKSYHISTFFKKKVIPAMKDPQRQKRNVKK
jgi:ribonuclease P protein component